MNQEIPATLLLDPTVIEDPYPFYRRLHRYAPVWQVPGTEVFVVSSFALGRGCRAHRWFLVAPCAVVLPRREQAPSHADAFSHRAAPAIVSIWAQDLCKARHIY